MAAAAGAAGAALPCSVGAWGCVRLPALPGGATVPALCLASASPSLHAAALGTAPRCVASSVLHSDAEGSCGGCDVAPGWAQRAGGSDSTRNVLAALPPRRGVLAVRALPVSKGNRLCVSSLLRRLLAQRNGGWLRAPAGATVAVARPASLSSGSSCQRAGRCWSLQQPKQRQKGASPPLCLS